MGNLKYVPNHIAAQPDKTQKICSKSSRLRPHLYGLIAVIYLQICLLSSMLNKGKHLKTKWFRLFDVAYYLPS